MSSVCNDSKMFILKNSLVTSGIQNVFFQFSLCRLRITNYVFQQKNGMALWTTNRSWINVYKFFHGLTLQACITLSSTTTGHSSFEESTKKGKTNTLISTLQRHKKKDE